MSVNPRYVGQRLKRLEDARLVRAHGRYVDDIQLSGTLHVAFVRSPHAHARIGAIDTTRAARVPGVSKVVTGADLDGVPVMRSDTMDVETCRPTDWPVLARDRVRYVGAQAGRGPFDLLRGGAAHPEGGTVARQDALARGSAREPRVHGVPHPELHAVRPHRLRALDGGVAEGPGRSRTVIYHLFPEVFFDRPGFVDTLAVYRDYQLQVLEEDRSMIESMQLAMASPAYRAGRMSTLEKPLHHYLNG